MKEKGGQENAKRCNETKARSIVKNERPEKG